MERRPEPDILDAEVFDTDFPEADEPRGPVRPDQGYRVGARIGVGSSGRTRLAAATSVGIVVAGIVLAAIGPLLPPAQEPPVTPPSSPSIPTPLPNLAILRAAAPTRLLPVFLGGLRWLDPATGAVSGDPYTAPRSGLFVDGAGHGLCLCLEIPWSEDQPTIRVTLRRYSAQGEEISRTLIRQLEPMKRRAIADEAQVDGAVSADGRHLWIVSAVRVETGWKIDLDRVDLATLGVEASLALDPIPAPTATEGGVRILPSGWVTHDESTLRATLRASPDGLTLSVLLALRSDQGLDPRLPAYQEERLEVPASLAAGSVPRIAAPGHDASAEPCDSEHSAWLTNRDFATICSRPDGAGIQPYIRIESERDGRRDVAVGPPVGTSDTEWLVDARDGVIYRWSALAHVFTRLAVASGSLTTLTVDPTGTAEGETASWPDPTGREAPWAPLTGPGLLFQTARLAGSADGTIIYALGLRSAADEIRDDRMASTGIWVFDAGRADLVAHWQPAALYDEIGFVPGGEQLVTLARPGFDADGGPADWSTSLRFHDPRTGEVLEVLGDVAESSGYVPAILTPNVPRGIAGF